jgi:hypothetical protein
MHGEVGWAYSLPARVKPRAIVLSLYGKGANQFAAFDGLHLPDAAAFVGAPLVIASADGGRDNYWHKRANGTDAHAMLVEEFVPLLAGRLGPLPCALHGYSMGGYGALLGRRARCKRQRRRLLQGRCGFQPGTLGRPGTNRARSIRRLPGLLRQRRLQRRRSFAIAARAFGLRDVGPVLPSDAPALRADDVAARSCVPTVGRPHQRLLAFCRPGPNAVPCCCLRLALNQGTPASGRLSGLAVKPALLTPAWIFAPREHAVARPGGRRR